MTFVGLRIYKNGSLYCPVPGPLSAEEAKTLRELQYGFLLPFISDFYLFLASLSRS